MQLHIIIQYYEICVPFLLTYTLKILHSGPFNLDVMLDNSG